jgi:hypothetical protein
MPLLNHCHIDNGKSHATVQHYTVINSNALASPVDHTLVI